MKRIFVLVWLLLLMMPGAFSQVKQYFFSHYTRMNGLLANRVQTIAQDHQGFLWIGTVSGLQRFDGHWFMNFRNDPKDPYSIPSNDIWRVCIDKQKNLWILFTNGQVGMFDTRTFRFREAKLKLPDERMKAAHKRFFQDSKGNLIIVLTNFNFVTYNEKENTFSAEYNQFKLPENWKLWQLIEEPGTGKYWAACDSGLAVYNSSTKRMSYRGHNADNNPVISRYAHLEDVGVMFIDSKKRFWFQSWTDIGAPSLYCYSLGLQQPVIDNFNVGSILHRYSEPKQLHEQSDGRIIMTGTPMLSEYSEELKSFIPIKNSLAASLNIEYEHVLQSYVDKEQNIWLCTRNEGIFKFNPATQPFTAIPHINPITGTPASYGMLAFLEMDDGTTLGAAWGEGIIRYDSNMNKVPLNIRGIDDKNVLTVWNMCRRKDGKIWMGLQDERGNLMIYDPLTNKATQYRAFYRVTVRQVAEDHDGNMWIGTQQQGLSKWTASRANIKLEDGFERFKAVPATQINNIYVDKQGFLWVSTVSDGLYKIDPRAEKVLEHLTSSSSPRLPSRAVGPVLQYNDSLMMIASGGLVIYDTKNKKTSFITTADGLPSDHAMAIEKDDAGYVWLSMMNGLCRINVAKRTIDYYDREDGMVNDNFSMDASLRLRDGRLLFGTNKDFVVFDPRHIVSGDTPQDVRITAFRLSDQIVPADSLIQAGGIELAYNNNSVSVDFSSLTYLQKNKLTYYYMLEGLDKDWVKAENIKRASYPYLAPGNYTFKVKAENSDGIFTTQVTSLRISVNPPFWQTWWFYSLLALATASLLFWFDRDRMKRKEAILKMRSDIAGNLHQEVNTALNNINILSEMAKLKADKEPQKSKEFIEQIHTRSHNMIIAMDDMLWSIDPGNDSMEKTVLRMKEYVQALNNRYGSNIEMLIDERVNALKLGMQLRHEAFILFKESILALVKAQAANCRIHVGVDRHHLVYTLEFRNRSCDMQQIRHLLERQDIKSRLSFLKASPQILVHKENSIIEMVLPVNS